MDLRSFCGALTACTHAAVALSDNSIVSDLDAADSAGNWEPVVQRLAQNVPTTMPQMELAFNIHTAPLGSAAATRTKHRQCWRTVSPTRGPSTLYTVIHNAPHYLNLQPSTTCTTSTLSYTPTTMTGVRSLIM